MIVSQMELFSLPLLKNLGKVAKIEQAEQLWKAIIYQFSWGTKQPGKYKTGEEQKDFDNRPVFCYDTF